TFAARLPSMPKLASHGALLCLRCNGEVARTMILTPRSMDFFRLIHVARWLYTSQAHRRYFSHATLDATRRWLRKHVASQYLNVYRTHKMAEAFFTLGPEGKRILELDGKDVHLERHPPKQLEHLMGINDVRIAADMEVSLTYFFACWELSALGWRDAII